MISLPKRRFISAALAVVALGVVAGFTGIGSSAKAAGDNSLLRIATYSGVLPTNLNPMYAQGRERADLENIYEPLVQPYLSTLKLKGVLATSWTVSPNGKTYRFKLRKGVKFHDGTPFNATAVKMSFDLDRKVATSDVAPLLNNVKTVRVVDANTVEFVIDGKGFPFLDRIASLSMLSPKAIREHGGDAAWWGSNTAGTGPYQLEEFVANDHLTLKRNDAWWGKKPFFPRVTFISVPESSTQQLMLQKGDVDIAYSLPPAAITQMQTNKDIKVISVPGDRVLNIRLNIQQDKLKNKVVRKALAYAFDYDAVTQALSTQVSPTAGPVPKQYLNGWLPADAPKRQDLTKAKALLAQAGVKPGELTIDANFVAGDAKQQVASEILQSSLAKIGVTVKLHLVDFDQTYQKLQRFREDPKANASAAAGIDAFTLVRGPFVPHPYAYFSSYELVTPYNYFNYANPSMGALLEKGYSAKTEKSELAFYKQAVEKVVADQPDIWAYVEKKVVAMRSDISGYYVSPNWFPETHVWTIRRNG
jgi:peptide/nickel transport system substrate-binding protein